MPDFDPATISAEFAELAERIERASHDAIAGLGIVATDGATTVTQDWVDELNDSAERVYDALDSVFIAINETPVAPVEEEPQPRDENDIVMSLDAAAILRYFLDNQGMRAEEVRRDVGSELENPLTTATFKEFRDEAQSALATAGIEIEWSTTGKTRGTRHYLDFGDHYELMCELLRPELVAEEPVPEEVPAELVPEPAESQPGIDLMDHRSDNGAAKKIESKTLGALVSDQDIIDLLTSQKAMRLGEVIYNLFGRMLDDEEFAKVRAQFSHLQHSGAVRHAVRGFYTTQRGEIDLPEPKPRPEIPVKDDDFEAMIKGIKTPNVGRMFKPKNRGRW